MVEGTGDDVFDEVGVSLAVHRGDQRVLPCRVEERNAEGVGGVAELLRHVPSSRVVFGSYAPFYYFESALLKLKESGLDGAQLGAISFGNAAELLP